MLSEKETSFIQRNCRVFGALDDASIARVLEVAQTLELFSQINGYDVFLVIKVVDEDLMFVIAERLSEGSHSEFSCVADFIYRNDEPAVFEAYDTVSMRESLSTVANKRHGGKTITTKKAIPVCDETKVVALLVLGKTLGINEAVPQSSLIQSSQISDIILALERAKHHDASLEIREGMMIFDPAGTLLYANKYCEDLYRSFGYGFILGRYFDALNLTSLPFTDLLETFALERAKASEPKEQGEDDSATCNDFIFFRSQTVSIGTRYFTVRYAVLEEWQSFLIMFIDDVTQSKRFEKGATGYLVTNLEMHHRIKNNLMTVVSLLRLQARTCDNCQAQEIIDVAIQRILAISATFELLMQGDNASVSVFNVLERISDNHRALAENSGFDLNIEIKGENFLLNSDQSTNLGIVINELLQNSVKHAFPNRTSGNIEITLSSGDAVKIIQIHDDGVGFDAEAEKEGTFGLPIIKGLLQVNLNGEIAIESGDNGTTVSLAFRQ